MDLTETIAPRSDQQNYDDYLGGQTRTVTVSAVTKGSAEQPVQVELAEYPGRPFKPNKSMRRVLVVAWGADSAAYIGRKMTLFGNPEVVFGGKAVGGVEISHLSHIDRAVVVPLTVTRGRRKNFTVQPLAADITPSSTRTEPRDNIDPVVIREWVETLETATSLPALQTAWEDATKAGVTRHPDIVAAKDKQKQALTNPDGGR